MNANIKKIALLGMLIALTGAQCWSAATDTRLFQAAESGNVEAVQKLLRAGINVDQPYPGIYITPLMGAAMRGHVLMVQTLLDNRANINAVDYSHKTALYWAAEHGRDQVVLLLLNAGANINTTDESRSTPLMAAAREGYDKVVELLLTYPTININAVNAKGDTALILAAQKPDARIVQMLLTAGADANIKNADRNTAFSVAQQTGNLPTIETLIAWARPEQRSLPPAYTTEALAGEAPPTYTAEVPTRQVPVVTDIAATAAHPGVRVGSQAVPFNIGSSVAIIVNGERRFGFVTDFLHDSNTYLVHIGSGIQIFPANQVFPATAWLNQ